VSFGAGDGQSSGLSDKADISTLGELLAGPPKAFIQDVFAFLRLLREGPPTRPLAEAAKIIEIMNMEEPWTADHLLRVRNFLRGPPALSLQDLQQMLDQAEVFKSGQTKYDSLQSEMDQLRAENEVLIFCRLVSESSIEISSWFGNVEEILTIFKSVGTSE
jgi:hypothetical protein